jgi:hypothetical protein
MYTTSNSYSIRYLQIERLPARGAFLFVNHWLQDVFFYNNDSEHIRNFIQVTDFFS